MVDYFAHWATLCTCSSCGEIPDSGPLYHCKFQHQYCLRCYEQLKHSYQGTIEGGCTCKVCNVSGKFQKSKINHDFLHKLKSKPGIGRPHRYFTTFTKLSSGASDADSSEAPVNDDVTVENLFRLPRKEIDKLFDRQKSNYDIADASSEEYLNNTNNKNPCNPVPSCSKYDDVEQTEQSVSKGIYNKLDKAAKSEKNANSVTLYSSRKPLVCPHYTCRKMVAISSLLTHYKHEHTDIPKFTVERGKELVLPFSSQKILHNLSYCLALIIVYEMNKIDVIRSKSSESVIKTCSKLSQKVPINTFWLMVSGSPKDRKSTAYAVFWLLANSDDFYNATIEVSSKFDRTSCSAYCTVNGVHDKCGIEDVAQTMNCLLLPRETITSLLQEGPELNLRIIIH